MESAKPDYPLLVIDTASSVTWAGVKTGPSSLVSSKARSDPTKGLFQAIAECLQGAALGLPDLASIAYCEGPGSMLGARTAVMAIRTWSGVGIPAADHLFAFTSLELGSLLLAQSTFADRPALLATDARRDSWNALRYPNAAGSEIELMENPAFETMVAAERLPVLTLSGFARWTQTTVSFQEIAYDHDAIFGDESYLRCLRPVEFAAPLALRESAYKKWSPKIHSAPTGL